MSTHLPLASSAASIGKGYPFRKMRRIFSCWEFPKPFYFLSLNIPSDKRLLLHFAPHYIPVSYTHLKARLPTHVEVSAKESGLRRDSVILAEQMRTIDKSRLRQKVAELKPPTMSRIENAVAVSIGLGM